VQIGVITLTYQICASFCSRSSRLHRQAPETLLAQRRMDSPDRHGDSGVCAQLCDCWRRPHDGPARRIFHPESSRIARFGVGGRHGLAQSIFKWAAMRGADGTAAAAWSRQSARTTSLPWFALAAFSHRRLKVAAVQKPNTSIVRPPAQAGRAEPVSARKVAWSIGILWAIF